ncbi:MAG: 2-isopropylmalate synthase [Candidatus Mycalebacterium zealandia]|nr:MAG: 2-isopropylmalate synthase [Candidatus Mycalebacterium zealandia]
MPDNYVKIFDTTLRDGEQAPGCGMTASEKLRVAFQLERLGVDVIEAGFPISSEEDFLSVRQIAERVRGCEIAALCRAAKGDIDRGWEAVKKAENPRIHTFIATSDIHLKHKLRKSHAEVAKIASDSVAYARKFTSNVEFSCEDATRTDIDYLCEVVSLAIKAGASTINIPDTVGYTVPEEFTGVIRQIRENVEGIDDIVLSVHCHNDLGLAVANSLAAVATGARQVECTINGLGERAGNASLEEIVMAIRVRGDKNPYKTGISTEQIYPSSKVVSQVTGVAVQPNKAVVGANAFAHEAGIHQAGVLSDRITYEIMKPEDVGISSNSIVLGKHSGRHAFRDRLDEFGYDLDDNQFEKAFLKFKNLADKKKYVFDEDIEALISEEFMGQSDYYEFIDVEFTGGSSATAGATVKLLADGKEISGTNTGGGPVDAAYKAIKEATGEFPKLESYRISAITGGTDAQGEVTVRIADEDAGVFSRGRGSDTDIIVASSKAFVNALNRLRWRRSRKEERVKDGI